MLCAAALAFLPAAAVAAPFSSTRFTVEVRGSGPDVLLIPGLSAGRNTWTGMVRAVPGYRYHVIHVSGFDGRPAGANASGPVLVPVGEEIARYIREAGLTRPAIVGHSMGGSWALLVGGRHPELVSKVMVIDMFPFLGAMFGGGSATPDSVRPVADQILGAMNAATAEQRQGLCLVFVRSVTVIKLTNVKSGRVNTLNIWGLGGLLIHQLRKSDDLRFSLVFRLAMS